MASTAPSAAPTVSTPSAAPTERFNNSGPSSNLYLVTFLATLFLLLFVSCAIVLRSYILRRRYQRRLEEAMAAGMLLAPRAQGSKRKRFGTKPKLVDTWLADGGEKWDQMMPLAAQPVFVKRKYRDWSGIPKHALEDPNAIYFPASPAGPSSSHDASAPSLQSRMRHLFRRHPREPAPSPTPPALNLNAGDLELVPPASASAGAGTSAATTPQSTTYKVRVEMLQVSVLIAMPSPSRTAQKNARLDARKSFDGRDLEEEEEEEDAEGKLPEVVIGVTRINHRQPKSQCPAIPPSPAVPASGAVSVSAAPTRTSTPVPGPTPAALIQTHES